MKQGSIINRSLVICLFLGVVLTGCKKFLDKKPDERLAVPTTIVDLQSLLDNWTSISQRDPYGGEVSSDDYYLTTADFLSRDENDRNLYIWNKDRQFKTGNTGNDWGYCYDVVYKSNLVLSKLDKITRTAGDEIKWNNLKGEALFLRGKSFLALSGVFSLAFDENSADTDMGIVLRLDPNFNLPSRRSTVRQSYNQVIGDLTAAAYYLPAHASHVLKPSKAAAFGLLARTYLWMRKYDKALLYADSCLQLNNALLDYNTLTASQTFPFAASRYINPEDIVHYNITGPPPTLSQSRAKIDSLLYRSYHGDDLRRTVFFRLNTGAAAGTYAFKGSYYGSAVLYCGVSTNEIYLVKAECLARAGDKDSALATLNALIRKRWKNAVAYPSIVAVDATEALSKVLIERRKELLMRGLRWMDIKRLNKEGANITLTRIISGQSYILPPNDPKYALSIPEDVINISGIPQNPR